MMNAVNSIKEEVQIDCIQLAFDIDAETPLSYEQFNAVVSKCDKAQLKKVE